MFIELTKAWKKYAIEFSIHKYNICHYTLINFDIEIGFPWQFGHTPFFHIHFILFNYIVEFDFLNRYEKYEDGTFTPGYPGKTDEVNNVQTPY